MNHRYQIGIKQFWVAGGTGLLLLPLILYGWLHGQRPPRTTQERSLFQGIVYRRESRSTPRPLMVHIVSIDLTAPGVKLLVTPGTPAPEKTEIPTEIHARTTSEFLREFKLQLAINASFFYPFREVTPWDYYPRRGERVNVVGQAISNGASYSSHESDLPVLCFISSQGGDSEALLRSPYSPSLLLSETLRERDAFSPSTAIASQMRTSILRQALPKRRADRVQLSKSKACPKGTVHAVTGNQLLVEHGNPLSLSVKVNDRNRPYSRVAVAMDKAGKKLWLIAIDGKQPLYSEGATLAELTKIILDLGADSALNLDGGGSTTLVAATPEGATVLNAPTHTKLPMRERPVANHIGFYALPTAK